MKKVLFIGPYRQNCGWSQAARSLIQSLLTTDIDLTLRHIYLASGPRVEIPQWSHLESKTQSSYDVIIQNCLPEFFAWYPDVKNIGFISTETNHLEFTPWVPYLNMMDEIWVHSALEITRLKNSGCTTPVCAINGGIDVNKFTKSYTKYDDDTFRFYSIGDGERKNFSSLLLAFHSEFDRNEPVDLTIKTFLIPNIQPFKQSLCLYRNIQQYKQEKIATDVLTEEAIHQLHYESDCFIMPSYGEAWCIPALDALGFGKTPIITDGTGSIEFVNNDNGWVVKSTETPISLQGPHNEELPYLYTARETWYQINIMDLRKAMREAYENKDLRLKKSQQGIQDIQKYSYENIGKKLYAQLYL